MKLLRKINKGFILTTIVLIAIITYIVCLEIQRNNEKGAIKEACEAYLAFEGKYTLLPKEYQSFTNKIPQEKFDEYKKEMSEELKKLLIDDENIYNLHKNIVESKLDEQIYEDKIYTLKNLKIVKIANYEFEDDQVTVTIEDSMQTEYLQKINNFEQEEQEIEITTQSKTNKVEDVITLKRENNTWKVVYANVGMAQDMFENYM